MGTIMIDGNRIHDDSVDVIVTREDGDIIISVYGAPDAVSGILLEMFSAPMHGLKISVVDDDGTTVCRCGRYIGSEYNLLRQEPTGMFRITFTEDLQRT